VSHVCLSMCVCVCVCGVGGISAVKCVHTTHVQLRTYTHTSTHTYITSCSSFVAENLKLCVWFSQERFLEPGAEYARSLHRPMQPTHPAPTPQSTARAHPAPHSPATGTPAPANPTTSSLQSPATSPSSWDPPGRKSTPRVPLSDLPPPESSAGGHTSETQEFRALNNSHNPKVGVPEGGETAERRKPEARGNAEGRGGAGVDEQSDRRREDGATAADAGSQGRTSEKGSVSAADQNAAGKGRASSGGGAMRIVASSAATDAAAPRAGAAGSEQIAQGKPDEKVC
jgi:hypothetical protein